MPELPEVETVRRGLTGPLVGHCLARVIVRRGDLRRPLPADFAERLSGRTVTAIDRLAKYLLFRFDNGTVLIAHLGMSGRMVRAAAGTPPAIHTHVIFETDAGSAVHFNDPRRFGLMALTSDNRVHDHELVRHLGPEPLDGAFDGAVLSAALAGRAAPIKALLLDQRIVAGLGNIYVCESLYRSRISPRRRGASVAGARAHRLVTAIQEVLNDAIAAGGSSLRDYVQADGELGYFQHGFAVYDRAGEACPSGGPDHVIRRIVQSNRSTFYCPKCQV